MKTIFTVALADIPIRVCCRYEENKTFLKEYLTDREPSFTVEPTEDDLQRIQRGFDQMAKIEGKEPQIYGERFLENNAIHALISEQLVRHNVLLLHGSALCMDGEAYIFTAPSGTGKSTHTRLWREVFGDRVWMINDDKPLLKVRHDDVLVYGTPWNGKHHLSQNAGAPLKAIVRLCRGEENHIEAIKKADAFPILMKQAFASENPASMAKILSMEKQILDTAAFYELHCNMLSEAAKVAWMGMNEGKDPQQYGFYHRF